MGFRPSDVDQMGLWEFTCCLAGFQKKDAPSGEGMTDEEARALGITGF